MNVKLQKNYVFNTGMVYENEFCVNVYEVTVGMTIITTDPTHQNIAYDRIEYWLNYVMNNSLLISDTSDKLDAYIATGQRVIALPHEPVDQVVGVMLYSKLSAIVEDRMLITDVNLSSSHGDYVVYLHNYLEDTGPLEFAGWCKDPRPYWAGTSKKKSSNKIISLTRMPEWAELDLAWEEATTQDTQNTVVFADFPKNENK
jgi:hypothetical protein